MDDALRPVDLDRRPVGHHGGDLTAGDGSTKWRGTPMDDALRPVDLDRRPVGLHGGELAAGDGSTKWRGPPMDDALRPSISIVAQSLCMAVICRRRCATADRSRSGGPAGALDDIRTGPAYPSRGRRLAHPNRCGHV